MVSFPRNEMIRTVTKLESLSLDLRRVIDGNQPDENVLRDAPLLLNWSIKPAPFRVLVGHVIGHPRLEDGEIMTSQLFMIEDGQNWARTFSRYYRLGAPEMRG